MYVNIHMSTNACMCVYAYIHIHTSICVYFFIRIYTPHKCMKMYLHICIHKQVSKYTCIHIFHACIYIYTYALWVHMCIHICICNYTCTTLHVVTGRLRWFLKFSSQATSLPAVFFRPWGHRSPWKGDPGFIQRGLRHFLRLVLGRLIRDSEPRQGEATQMNRDF